MAKLLPLLLLLIGTLLLSVEGRTLRTNHIREALTPLPKAATNVVGQDVTVTNDHSTKSANHGISLRTLTVNIVADLCPHGMLHLAYGLARGGPTGIIPAVFLVALCGAMSAYSMVVLAHLSKEVGAESIGDLWGRLKSQHSKWVIDASVMTLCYGCCVFNAATVGDIVADCAQTMGLKNIPRGTAISLPLFMLLPFCLQDDLSGLQVTSGMGAVGIVYTVLFLVKRWLDQTYAPGSYFLKYVDPELRPHFTSSSSSSSGLSWLRINSGTLVLVNLLCVAFLAQHNSITYFRELNSTLEQYQKGITYGFGITAAVFLMMMFVGYQMFGNAVQPLMLNNFPDKDGLANMARLCVGAAMAFAFPVMFIALKSAVSALVDTATVPRNRLSGDIKSVSRADDGDSSRVNKWKTIATVVTLVSITKIAEQCNRNEVSSVLGIIVPVFGCLVAYILPNYLSILHNHQRHKAGLTTNRREVAMNYFMAILGALFGVLGVWMAVTNTAAHH